MSAAISEAQSTQEFLSATLSQAIEDAVLWLGFTPQNVCGAPAGYSFHGPVEADPRMVMKL